jgi:choline dehydrogenase-like flavoprotein
MGTYDYVIVGAGSAGCVLADLIRGAAPADVTAAEVQAASV